MRVIVNCGIGWHYGALSAVVRSACERYCPDAELRFFPDYPTGCPSHAEQQYAFKIFALREAIAEFPRAIPASGDPQEHVYCGEHSVEFGVN